MKTKAIKSILFPTDFSNGSMQALNYAIKLAKKTEAKLIVLNVVDMPFNLNTETESVEGDLITSDLIRFSKVKLKAIELQIQTEHSLQYEAITYVGETLTSIAKAVREYSTDIIIMGTKITKDLFFKSSSFSIVNNTFIPLITVSEAAENINFNAILFPFNERLITLQKTDDVLKIAKLYDSKIILLGVLQEDTLEKRQIITNNLMFVKSIFDDHKIACDVHFEINSDYSSAILEYCEKNKIDLITVANSSVEALPEHATALSAKNVINHSQIPVLTIPVNQGY